MEAPFRNKRRRWSSLNNLQDLKNTQVSEVVDHQRQFKPHPHDEYI